MPDERRFVAAALARRRTRTSGWTRQGLPVSPATLCLYEHTIGRLDSVDRGIVELRGRGETGAKGRRQTH
jgi:hypothetical protein